MLASSSSPLSFLCFVPPWFLFSPFFIRSMKELYYLRTRQAARWPTLSFPIFFPTVGLLLTWIEEEEKKERGERHTFCTVRPRQTVAIVSILVVLSPCAKGKVVILVRLSVFDRTLFSQRLWLWTDWIVVRILLRFARCHHLCTGFPSFHS